VEHRALPLSQASGDWEPEGAGHRSQTPSLQLCSKNKIDGLQNGTQHCEFANLTFSRSPVFEAPKKHKSAAE
jgi:hypothetical protein